MLNIVFFCVEFALPPTICHVSYSRLLQRSEAFDLLLNLSSGHPDVASSKPIGVVKPATFAVANTAVGKLDDLKADDVGVWEHKGKPVRSYRVSRLTSITINTL